MKENDDETVQSSDNIGACRNKFDKIIIKRCSFVHLTRCAQNCTIENTFVPINLIKKQMG